ncbi:MAG: serine--tRNA ligase [Pelolinea sp.]|jgi:seryl-tRNA synthetase|nr:serine--tRNA ligase [Pelolinea sp.]
MIDIKLVREEPQTVRNGMQKRNLDSAVVDELLAIDEERRELLQKVETLKAERNTVSREIGTIKDKNERDAKIAAMKVVSDSITSFDEKIRSIEEKQKQLIMTIPNIPLPQVPVGKDESENIVLKTAGEKPAFDFEPLPHWELGEKLGILDFERGVKITGSRFYILSGLGARLQRALIAFMLDLHIRQGYLEKYTPFMVKSATLFAAGQLPKFADNLYKDHEEDLYMVPTAEVPLTGLHMDEFIDAETLPLRYTAYTPCFRREKMSAGRDVRGIKRGHQFDKVEMYTYCKPEESMREFERMVADAEETCKLLGLTYRVLQLCTGDISFNACIGYDLEVWAPGCQEWLEVSSISNVGNFQARRANIKYKDADGRKDYVHTLNGSGLGMPRTLIAVMENYQQPDGSIRIPEVLLPWMGGATEIR